jgi:putative nucleotidyltransferase with HDIG domain
MNGKHLFFCQNWFDDYTSRFHCPDAEIEKNINLKLMHTYRVRENIAMIARSLGMKEEDLALAKALALLHDVGRFEQLRGFGSFNDCITVDHAKLGLQVINRSGVLSFLPKEERNLIRKSIWHHNKYQIPVTEKADVALFSKLIRDADKLDILGIVARHFETREEHPNQALDFGLTGGLELTEEVVSDILQGKMVQIAALKTLGDLRLMYSSWIFDINFPLTLANVKERGYLERLLADLSMQPDIIPVSDFLQAFLEKRSRVLI